MSNCPGQDRRFWSFDDISMVKCPVCSLEIEFFKDDGKRKCPSCGTIVKNPRVLLGCASWCAFSEECIGISSSKKGDDYASIAAALIHWLRGKGNLDHEAAADLYNSGMKGDELGEETSFPLSALKLAFIVCRYLSLRGDGDSPKVLLPEVEEFLEGYGIAEKILTITSGLVLNLYEEWPAEGDIDLKYLTTLLDSICED